MPLALLTFCVVASAVRPQPLSNVMPVQSSGEDADVPDAWLERVSQDIRREEYGFSSLAPGVFSAPNRSQEVRARVSLEGLEVFPRSVGADGEGAPWRLELRTRSFGRTDGVFELGEAALEARGERVELDHGWLVEWLENRTEGIEQGWTITVRPSGAEPLWIGLELGGDLALRIEEGARSGILMDATGETRLRYTGLCAFDATGRELEARLLSGPDGVGILVEDAGATYPLTVDPLLSGPAWTAESDQAAAYFGFSVSTAGDVNGDGYSDVIVGAAYFDNGQLFEGRAFVYHGSASGLATSPAWTGESNQGLATFGSSVSTAGDVNGDGYSDVIVGAYFFDNGETDEGRAFVYHGSASGLGSNPAWTAESDQTFAYFGYSSSTAGDVNGDGYSDVIVGAYYFDNDQTDEGRAYVYLGSSSGLATSPAWTGESNQTGAGFGLSVSTAGDVNGDGYSDVIVGAPFLGRTFVYHGSASGLATNSAWTAESDQALAYFGQSVSTAGDVNGDGYSDVLVGAPHFFNGQSGEGRAFVYYGSSSGLASSPAWTGESDQAGAAFGLSVSTAGDVNGDGYSDVLVGAYTFDNGQTDEGRAYLYQGSSSGLASSPAWTGESDQALAYMGTAVSTAGDVNGDGYSDVIVGAPFFDNGQTDEGRAFVYHGSSSGPASGPAWTAESDQADALFGYSVSTAGDVNGDGYSDVIVGAPLYNVGAIDMGRAYVYHGSASGLAASPAWTGEGNQLGAAFGYSVSTAGDVNGDGYSDVIVSAIDYDNGQNAEGRAYVYHGSSTGLASSPAWMAESNQDNAEFGSSVSTAGDVNGDGYSDVIVGAHRYGSGEIEEGRAFVYHGSSSGLATSPAWTGESNQTGANFGWSVSTAGDVNGDGYSDVIVGARYYTSGETSEGRAYVYRGSPSGLASSPTWTKESNAVSALFGSSVSTAGDLNGDGYSDVVVGSPGQVNRIYAYHGSSSGLVGGPALMGGFVVSTAGDVNGDGYSDVVSGGPDDFDGPPGEGIVYVHLGSAGGPSPNWYVGSDQADAALGWSVSTAGDVNGDGYSDVIAGAPIYDHGDVDEGRAFVYLGNGGAGGLMRTLQQRDRTDTHPIAVLGHTGANGPFHLRAEFPGNLAGHSWASPETPEAWLEWEIKPLVVAFDGSGIQRGASQPLVPGDETVSFDEIAGVDEGAGRLRTSQARSYHWRARVATNNPLFRHTAWFSVPGSNITEAKLRKPRMDVP